MNDLFIRLRKRFTEGTLPQLTEEQREALDRLFPAAEGWDLTEITHRPVVHETTAVDADEI